ncbi:MAG: hypothetical protein M1308_20385 [Actinobacteria bacterium]|nr:hypothetical protein [Actinomycetota bacterium]
MVDEVRKINKDIKIAYHSDGKIEWALDDLIDIGINILNSLQPNVNDVKMIKKKYGKKLSFWGNVDTRRVLNIKTFKEVAEEVRKTIEILSPGGGHILCTNHVIQASARAVDNTIVYYWAVEKFRNYLII